MTRFYTAAEAEKMGLVNTVVPVSLVQSKIRKKILSNCENLWTFSSFFLVQLEKLEQETIKWCREIVRNSPTAIRVLKSALNAVDDGHAGLQVLWLNPIQYFITDAYINVYMCIED